MNRPLHFAVALGSIAMASEAASDEIVHYEGVLLSGGADCRRDGQPFVLPDDNLSCRSAKSDDPLCSLGELVRITPRRSS